MTGQARRRGFTLIELILVMAVLVIAVAMTTPTLAYLFRGRLLGEEGRRLLALTRHARSQAVSLAVPMQIWIEPDTGQYGLQPDGGYATDDIETLEFTLANGITFGIDDSELGNDNRVTLRFLPDGSIDEKGAKSVTLDAKNGKSVALVLKGQTEGYVLEATGEEGL